MKNRITISQSMIILILSILFCRTGRTILLAAGPGEDIRRVSRPSGDETACRSNPDVMSLWTDCIPTTPEKQVHDVPAPKPDCQTEPRDRSGSVTWTCEDWNGSFGAIASSSAVTADGSRIYIGWSLNYEHVAAFDAIGDGTPLWEYDLREEDKYNIDGDIQILASADGSVVAAAVPGRNDSSGTTQESVLLGFNIDTGEEIWRYTTPPTVQDPDKGEWIGPVAIAVDGTRIACTSYGYRQDPVFEPVFITILNGQGQELHRIELPDAGHEIMYLNDLKLTADGAYLAADFRMNTNPTHKIMVWDLSDYSERASWGVNNSPPQGQLGLSDDASVLAIGDLRGKIQVYIWHPTEGRGEYSLSWSYTIPPDYYYAWVVGLAVSPDGHYVAAGSYQANETTTNAYLYLFETDVGPSSKIQSSNFRGTVQVVAFSGDGNIAAGAGYGPYPETDPGYDLIAMSSATGEEIYRMDGETPGSLQDCALNSDGTRLTCGGKRVHAYQMGSGGLAYSIELDTTPAPTPEPTATATATPSCTVTPTPSQPPTVTPTPTQDCDVLGCRIDMPAAMFQAGDRYYCNVIVCNPGTETYDSIPVFMILDVYGLLLFAPEFNDFSYYLRDIAPGTTSIEIIGDFYWPSGAGQASDIRWYAGMTDPLFIALLGDFDMVTWGWK